MFVCFFFNFLYPTLYMIFTAFTDFRALGKMPKFSPKKIENRNRVGQQQQQQPHFWKRRGMRGKGGHPAVRHQQPHHHQQQKPAGVGAVQQHPVGRPTHQPTAASTPPQQPQQAEFPKCASDVLSKVGFSGEIFCLLNRD